MDYYQEKARIELKLWQKKISKKPSAFNRVTKGVQSGITKLIPEQIHKVVTASIKKVVYAVLIGSEYTTTVSQPINLSFQEKEKLVLQRLSFYKKAAAAEGAGAGAGGFMFALADFPILLGLEFKFLFDIASIYGFDVKNYHERLYILYLFQLAFSSEQRRKEVYDLILNWQENSKALPASLEGFDWRTFQQEYRDYIDLAKMLQLVPGIGSVAGAYANYRLLDTLGEMAMNGYRLRILKI